MSSPSLTRLTGAALGLRGTDQLMLAGAPLAVVSLFNAGADVVGLVVAAQGAAWLLASLPAGVWIDRIAPQVALRAGLALAMAGAIMALAGVLLGLLLLFTLGCFVAACGTVVGALAEGTSLQAAIPPAGLPSANSRLQLVQSGAMLAGPLAMGWLAARGVLAGGYIVAIALTLLGLLIAWRLTPTPPQGGRQRDVLAEIHEGVAFVRREPHLRGVVGCALFWNMAFLALVAVFAPYALGVLRLSAADVGLAMAAQGVGSLLAAVVAGIAMRHLQPRAILVFGPAGSCAAALLLAYGAREGDVWVPALVFAIIGFGPILWFVCQNTIRQLVTPRGLLGRVGSVIQIAIYGVRAIGAVVGGWVASRHGFDAALMLVVVLFGLSTLAVLTSRLSGLRSLPAMA